MITRILLMFSVLLTLECKGGNSADAVGDSGGDTESGDADADSDVDGDTDADGDADADADGDTDTDSDTDGDGDSDTDTDGDTDTDTDGDTDADADGDTDADADGDTDADADGDTDSDADGDTDTDADGDTDPNRIRVVLSADKDWRFFLGDSSGAREAAFDDSTWRTLDVPHDWSIEEPFVKSNPSGPAGGYATCGIGWYRRHFDLPEDFANKRVFIEFDGVMQNSDVYLNGTHLGARPNGYVSFRYDITDAMHTGNTPNVLAVRVDNSAQPASRWYTGSGIYRHVRLIATAAVHIDAWSTFVSAENVTDQAATARVRTAVLNAGDAPKTVLIAAVITDPNGNTLDEVPSEAVVVPAGQTADFSVNVPVPNPLRWDLDTPNLYTARVWVSVDGVPVDDDQVMFGIRTIEFNPDTGFFLNGRNVKIKGVCLHHDMSGLGAAVPLRAWQRRLAQIKDLGANGVRTSHNPVAPEVLDLMDRMGLLVMDEFFDVWRASKEPYDLSRAFTQWGEADLTDTLKRDRNHPSIVIYSIGNEIRDSLGVRLPIAQSLVDICHEVDATRPVTQGLFRPDQNQDYPGNMLDVLDVFGVNYRIDELIAANAYSPKHPIIATEMPSNDGGTNWNKVKNTPAVAGYFIWTGADYLGEAETWSDDPWPYVTYPFGLLDRMGNPTAAGIKHRGFWTAAKSELSPSESAGSPPSASAPLRLGADKAEIVADWNDVAYVRADIVDGTGNIRTAASNPIAFTVEGPGTLVAVDSASPNAEAFRGDRRNAYQGTCYAIVRAEGEGDITVTATADIGSATIHIAGRVGEFRPCTDTCD